MVAEPTPLKVPYTPYKFTGRSVTHTEELVEMHAKEKAKGADRYLWFTGRWMGDEEDDGGELSEGYGLDPDSADAWEAFLRALSIWRPGINWMRIIEPFRAAFAPFLIPLTVSEHKRKLLTVEDLRALPPLCWTIDGHLPLGAFAVLYGPSGSGKTFLALDLTLSIAAAGRWMGHEVRGGPTLYIAAEGIGGLAQRVEAWRASRADCDLSGVRFLGQTVNLLDERDVNSLLADIAEMDLPPALVVFDTLARCIPGGDENSARDMGLAVAAIDRIRAATGATVLAIHHTGKNGDTERGSSALRGAADTMLAVTNDDGLIKIQCDKQKDAPEFERMYARLVSYGESAFVGKDAGIAVTDPNAPLSRQETATLDVLTAIFGEDGATPTRIADQARIPERTVYEVLKNLMARGVVTKKGKGHAVRYAAVKLS